MKTEIKVEDVINGMEWSQKAKMYMRANMVITQLWDEIAETTNEDLPEDLQEAFVHTLEVVDSLFMTEFNHCSYDSYKRLKSKGTM